MDLEELKAKLPPAFQPWVAQYGPAFLAMGAEELKAWIERLIAGDTLEAYRQVLAKLPNEDLLTEWTNITADWQVANERNASKIDVQKAAASAVLKILLTIALAAAGF